MGTERGTACDRTARWTVTAEHGLDHITCLGGQFLNYTEVVVRSNGWAKTYSLGLAGF